MLLKLCFLSLFLLISRKGFLKDSLFNYILIVLSFIFFLFYFHNIFLTFLVIIFLVIYISFNVGYKDSSIIILDGMINFRNMFKNKISIFSLLLEMKNKNISTLSDKYCAILKDGKINFYIKESVNIPVTIVLNGKINYSGIKVIKKDLEWLNCKLEKMMIHKEKILYAFYYKSVLYVIKK